MRGNLSNVRRRCSSAESWNLIGCVRFQIRRQVLEQSIDRLDRALVTWEKGKATFTMSGIFCCCTWIDGGPIDGDRYPEELDRKPFQISMGDALTEAPGCCCLSFFCPFCAQYTVRQKALGGVLDDVSFRGLLPSFMAYIVRASPNIYICLFIHAIITSISRIKNICCLGYYPPCLCFSPGKMGEKDCPALCLIAEVCFCCGCSISATRMYTMDMYNLHSDACDRRIIRFNNCIQCLSCLLIIASIFVPPLRQVAENTNRAAEVVYLATQACMVVQVNHELDHHDGQGERPPIVVAQPQRKGAKQPLLG
jgi:hypothetical protein